VVVRNFREGRLRFTTSLAEAVALSRLYFIAVGTPPNEDGSADLRHVLGVAFAYEQATHHRRPPGTVMTRAAAQRGTGKK